MKLYKSYNFKDKDPVIDRVRTLIQDAGISHEEIERRSGVTTQTLRNWFTGPTKRPVHSTVMAVVKSLGYEMAFVRKPAVVHRAATTQKAVGRGK